MKRLTDKMRTRGLPAAVSVGMVALVASALMLTGCPEDLDEEELQPDDSGQAEVEMDVEVGDGFEDDETYSRPVYDGRRNPFRPDQDVIGDQQESEQEVSEDRPTAPLEQYELNSLELVTIISQKAVPRAMFVDPTGMGHFAKEGDRIGTSGGMVNDIRANEVEIQEGQGETAATVTVELREAEIEQSQVGGEELSEEEREALRELMESEEAREALSSEGQEKTGDGSENEQDSSDERFPGLTPPGEE